MKTVGRCVFRCWFNGNSYRVMETTQVFEVSSTKLESGKRYWTYVGKKKLDETAWCHLGGAIGSILLELSREVLTDIKEIW